MDWLDYRQKLKIGFSDNTKFEYFRQKCFNFFDATREIASIDEYLAFCNMTGSEASSVLLRADLIGHENIRYKDIVQIIKNHSKNLSEFLAYYIAFVNTRKVKGHEKAGKTSFYNLLTKLLKESHIPFEVIKDEGDYFVFPKGVEEFDNQLVSEPLMWLSKYPKARKTYTNALKQYADGTYIRDVADNFRKSLEEFLQEFHDNSKNLDGNISVTGRYLKDHGAEPEIADELVKLIGLYKKLNDKIAKHNDKVDEKFLEFLMYQTGIFIRMLLVVKNSDTLKKKSVAQEQEESAE